MRDWDSVSIYILTAAFKSAVLAPVAPPLYNRHLHVASSLRHRMVIASLEHPPDGPVPCTEWAHLRVVRREFLLALWPEVHRLAQQCATMSQNLATLHVSAKSLASAWMKSARDELTLSVVAPLGQALRNFEQTADVCSEL